VTRVLITGVTGQDGSYLAQESVARGYEVYGLVRGQQNPRLDWIKTLIPRLKIVHGDLLDQMSLVRALEESTPDLIYNLGGITAPSTGWNQPVLTADVTGLGVLRLLEAAHRVVPQARVLQASSIAMHGPYGAAKMFAQMIAEDYRARGMHVSCAVMGGHHSVRRGREFFARKVTRAVYDIKRGAQKRLIVGPLSRQQDWGWAANFVSAMQMMLERMAPGTYVMSTGEPHSNKEWVSIAFAVEGLDWTEYVDFDDSFQQPTDVDVLSASPSPELLKAGWAPLRDLAGLASTMVRGEPGER
jgi:GDPmannose 4,6-dehydratase